MLFSSPIFFVWSVKELKGHKLKLEEKAREKTSRN